MKALANQSTAQSRLADSDLPTTSEHARLQHKCACGGTPGPTGECEQCKRKRLALKGKLAVNQPGDRYEVEADRIAEAVMAKNVHRKASSSGQISSAPHIVDEVLAGSGQPLDSATRALMEEHLGYDFGHVRIHTDARAAESARAVNAQGYTVGQDVVFATGRYAPRTAEGQKLLAHELAHVVQQAGGPKTGTKAKIETQTRAYEEEADKFAERITKPGLGLAGPKSLTTSGVLVQRQDDKGAVETSGSSPSTPMGTSWSLDDASILLRSANTPPKCEGMAWGSKSVLISSCRAAEACAPRGVFEFQFHFHLDSAAPAPPVPSGTTPKRVSLGAAFITNKGARTFSRHQADANPAYVKQGAPLATILGKSFSFPTSESGTLIIQLALEVAHPGGVFNLVYQDNIPCNLVPCA